MNTYNDLRQFIDFAKNNRKYAVSTANNLKSALKIFERELTPNELDSIDIIEQNIEEIFITVINKNKDKDINSLATYKARLLKVIGDYKKFGKDPSKIQNWIVRHRPISTPLLKSKDKEDKPFTDSGKTQDNQDKISTPVVKTVDKDKIILSSHIPTAVEMANNCHKIELALPSGKATLIIPGDIDFKEIKMIKFLLDSLVKTDL